jgi:hypothetical protein
MSILTQVQVLKDKAAEEAAKRRAEAVAYEKRKNEATEAVVESIAISLKELEPKVITEWTSETSCKLSQKGCTPICSISVGYRKYSVPQDDEGHFSNHEGVCITLIKNNVQFPQNATVLCSNVEELEKHLAKLLWNVL